MKTLNIRWRSIALVLLVALAILSIGSRTGVVPAQNKEVREAANDVGITIQGGIVVQGGITQGQSIRFNNTWISGRGRRVLKMPFNLPFSISRETSWRCMSFRTTRSAGIAFNPHSLISTRLNFPLRHLITQAALR